jgi:membrane protein DedA with SNARE-associated domain/rhodanese-related sulfurtransferase
MAIPSHILLTYGYLLLFTWVLIEQLGIPLPATPVLLAAGGLSAEHEMNFGVAFVVGLLACLIADTSWFLIGRRYGHHVLRLLCRLSMEPTICVRRTQDSFGRRRSVMLMFAKFVPGLATLAAPVAGENGMSLGTFLFFDGIGASLWLMALLIGGRLFGDALKRDPNLLAWVGRFSGAILLLAIMGWFGARLYRRRAVLKKLVQSRLEPSELKAELDAGEQVYIVDLRHPLELLAEPYTLPHAVHFSPDALAARKDEIPRDRDVVLFCTCPSEATAAKTALTLHKLGIERVRPLRGGYDEWKRLGFPLDAIPPVNPMVTVAQVGHTA